MKHSTISAMPMILHIVFIHIYIHFNDSNIFMYTFYLLTEITLLQILSLNSVNSFMSFCLASLLMIIIHIYIYFRMALVYTAFLQINNGPLSAYVSSSCFYYVADADYIVECIQIESITLWCLKAFFSFEMSIHFHVSFMLLLSFFLPTIVLVNIWSRTNNHHTNHIRTRNHVLLCRLRSMFVCLFVCMDDVRVYEFHWIVIFLTAEILCP